ncbi:MAG TPA: TIGR01212 family radical SAM protein [Candidatus Hypogeohydataceae bacterium YC40]
MRYKPIAYQSALGEDERLQMDYPKPRPWQEEERYYSFSRYLKERFPFKVHKIALHAGFTCPNRDGYKGTGGCTYCANESFSPNARGEVQSIREQVKRGKEYLKRRYGAEKFIVYFQAFSNTYADIKTLSTRYNEALEDEDVIGLSIGTRPDCVPDEVLELLNSYKNNYHLWIEYGLQSIHDRTLRRINRCHTYKDFEEAVQRTKALGINVCAHVILGLPEEDWADTMATAEALAKLGIDGVKLHHLYIARSTPMAEEYSKGLVKTMEAEEYVTLAADFLERILPETTIQRLVGDTHGDALISPIWPFTKAQIFQSITGELCRRNSYQGKKWRQDRKNPNAKILITN